MTDLRIDSLSNPVVTVLFLQKRNHPAERDKRKENWENVRQDKQAAKNSICAAALLCIRNPRQCAKKTCELTGWSDGTLSATYTYDDDSRRLSETVNYGNGVSLHYAYTYTAAGYKKTLQYPDTSVITYTYDAHGGLSQLDIPGEGSISVNEWNWVVPKKMTLPGGTTRELSHDGLLKLTGLKVKNPGEQTVLELLQKYGKLEELKEKNITDSDGSASSTAVTQYTYDSEQRLIQTVRDTGGVFGSTTETFGVDAAGNRISHSAVAGAWTYDKNNRLIKRGGYANSDPVNQVDPTGQWVWVVIRVAMTVYDVYTEYKEIKEKGECYDWTRLIPIPVKIPRIKWLTKRFKKCSNPCECMMGGGGGKNSFPGDTLVHAQDEQGNATLKAISSLKLGDKVLAKSEWKTPVNSLSYEPVTDIFVTPNQQRILVYLTLDNGQKITTTDGHPFKTTEGWRDAILLKEGVKLLLKGGGSRLVAS